MSIFASKILIFKKFVYYCTYSMKPLFFYSGKGVLF